MRPPGSTCQLPNAASMASPSASCDPFPTAMTVTRDGSYIALMERQGLPGVHRAERYFAADGQVTVGMRPVEPLGEHALGDGRRHVAHLQQPVEAQIAHTLEVPRFQPAAG